MGLPDVQRLHIQTPDGTVFDGVCESLLITTEAGQIEILPGHTSLLSRVLFSMAHAYLPDGMEKIFAVRHGLLYVDNDTNSITLNAFSCDLKENIRHESLSEYHREILEQLKNGNLTPLQVKFLHNQSESIKAMVEEHQKL